MTTIAIYNQKGGVGKTTTTFNLAAAMARVGMAPIMIDLDPQAHLTSLCGRTFAPSESIFTFFQKNKPLTDLIHPLENGVFLIPSHLELGKVEALYAQKPGITKRLQHALTQEMLTASGDPILIDCGPMLGVLVFNALAAADSVLAPVSAEYLALRGTENLDHTLTVMEAIGDREIDLRVLLTRYVSQRKLSQEVVAKMKERYGNALCETRIRESAAITSSAGVNQDIFTYAPRSPGAKDYADLLDELIANKFIDASTIGQIPQK